MTKSSGSRLMRRWWDTVHVELGVKPCQDVLDESQIKRATEAFRYGMSPRKFAQSVIRENAA